MAEQPLPDRTLLLHAVGIVEWSGALEHLRAMEAAGVPESQPMRRFLARNMIQQELVTLVHRWPRLTSITMTTDEVIDEARQYVTKHQHHLDDLLNEGE